MRSLAVALLGLGLAGLLEAQARNVIVTVDDLHGVCGPALTFAERSSEDRSPEEAVQLVRCFGFVEGLVSTVIRLSVAGFMTDPLYEGTFCFPESTQPRDWIESFVTWAEENPDKRDAPAVDGFLLALIQDFPCQASDEPTPSDDAS